LPKAVGRQYEEKRKSIFDNLVVAMIGQFLVHAPSLFDAPGRYG
jgi:hypothetical protein